MRDLVLFVHAANRDEMPRREVLAVLTERFGLSFDAARRAMDRVCGGIVRAGNPDNEPDPVKDPVAWTSFRTERGLPVDGDAAEPSAGQRATAQAFLEEARRSGRMGRTEDVAVALEVARSAIASQEPAETRVVLLVPAATALSSAAEACIARVGEHSCAPDGSQEWADGAVLAATARRVSAEFATGPDPELERRGLMLAGRIVTALLGQCPARLGQAMVETARCARREGDSEWAARHVQPLVHHLGELLGDFEEQDEDPYDEYVIAFEYLLAAVGLITEVRGSSRELSALGDRAGRMLARAEFG